MSTRRILTSWSTTLDTGCVMLTRPNIARTVGQFIINAFDDRPVKIQPLEVNFLCSLCYVCLNVVTFMFYPALVALRALWLLLPDSAPTVGQGKTFWHISRVPLTKTEPTPRVTNALLTKNGVPYKKKQIFGPKSGFSGPKKTPTF